LNPESLFLQPVSPYRMGVQRLGVKGAGFGVQCRASAGGAAECGSKVLVFDLQALLCLWG
jgi:hypothetical protein